MATAPIQDLVDFKHLKRPKDWNLPGMKALFELLDLGLGEARRVTLGERGPVLDLQRCIETRVGQLVNVASELRAGITFWSGVVISEDDADALARKLDKTKEFLESVRPFNTPGKFKNFTHSSAEIRRLGAGLEDLLALRALRGVVRGELGALASYLATAAAILPDDHAWGTAAEVAKEDVLSHLRDRGELEWS